MTTTGSGTFLDLDFKSNPGTGNSLKKLATVPGPGVPGTPVGLRADGYIEPGQHPPGGLLGGSLEPGTHLNSLPNGAFQDGLVGWTQAVSGSGAVAIDPGNSLSGTNALKLTTTATADSASATSLRVPVSGGVSFYLSVVAKTLSGSPPLSVVMSYFDAKGAALSSGATATPIAAFTPGATMAETGVVVTPPAAARYATFAPTVTGAVGAAEVDEVRIDQTMLAKFTAAPAAHRRALNVFSVSIADFCNIAATADHTAAFGRAVAAIVAAGGGEIVIPDGHDYYFSASIALPGQSGICLHVKAMGRSARLRRVKGYKGNIFNYNGNTQGNCRVTISDIFFFSDYSADTPPGAAAIYLNGGGANQFLVKECLFWDQYAAIDMVDMAGLDIVGCRVFHSAQAIAAGFGGYSGLFFTGHCTDILVSDFRALGQDSTNANNLKYGILIQGADGIQFDNVYVHAFYGIRILGGQGANIDDVYFTNLVSDNCNYRCISIEGNNAPNAYTNIRFSSVHADAHNSTPANGSSNAIVILGDADGIQFDGLNCGLSDGTGLYISGSTTNWQGLQRRDIRFSNIMVYDSNASDAQNNHGILIDCPGVTLIGGSSRNRSSAGYQMFGIAVTNSGSNATIIGMDVSSNKNTGIYQDPNVSGLITSANRTA